MRVRHLMDRLRGFNLDADVLIEPDNGELERLESITKDEQGNVVLVSAADLDDDDE